MQNKGRERERERRGKTMGKRDEIKEISEKNRKKMEKTKVEGNDNTYYSNLTSQ